MTHATKNGTRAVPRRVLVVDDDPVIRFLATATLAGAGFAAEAVEDGSVAIRRLAAGETWDLVLTDLDMLDVGGHELLRSIRSTVATATLPVVVLTGSSHGHTESELLAAGASGYMRKPIDPPLLVERVSAALQRAEV